MLDAHSLCQASKQGKPQLKLTSTATNASLFRRKNVRRKLNAMALEFHGKNVLLVDGKLFIAVIFELC